MKLRAKILTANRETFQVEHPIDYPRMLDVPDKIIARHIGARPWFEMVSWHNGHRIMTYCSVR